MKTIFAEMGEITDLKLKYTKNGVFRRFAFVGYKTLTEAQRALEHFNKTYVDTSKIEVDICRNLGDDTMPRPWSKYSEQSSAFQKKLEKLNERKRMSEGDNVDDKSFSARKIKKKKRNEILGELEDDADFQEFLEIHKTVSKKNVWNNDEQFFEEKMKKKSNDQVGNQIIQQKVKVQFDAHEKLNNETILMLVS